MTYRTKISIDGEPIVVEWHHHEDWLIPENKKIEESLVDSVEPESARDKYGDSFLIMKCLEEEKEIQEQRDIEKWM